MKHCERIIGLEQISPGIGAMIKGWDIPETHFRDPNTLSVVDFRAMTNACPWDCFHCFTEKSPRTLSLDEIKSTIQQVAKQGALSMQFIGEGEPSIDRNFLEILQCVSEQGMQPIVYTDGATKFRDRDFVRAVKDTGTSIIIKCDSLFNPEFQNAVLGDKKNEYFMKRAQALELLMDEGFNETQEDGTTRLGFDMVVCRSNMQEVERTLRFCRNKNLWIMFAFYLTSGRSNADGFDNTQALTDEEKARIIDMVRGIDSKDYGYEHPVWNNFIVAPCVEMMQIYGDGRVSPCPGNEQVIGNIREHTIAELHQLILEKCSELHPSGFDGHCPYRSNPLK
ncbi:radical SAM protein [Candidatus Peregrinibacteria bacterium]|nr:radical SAM protein [Candidatus Peregrinibacteria bacterium]